KTTKSLFDLSSPSASNLSLIYFALTNCCRVSGNITGFTSGTMDITLNYAPTSQNAQAQVTIKLNAPTSNYFFSEKIPSGYYYNVFVSQHPSGLSCSVSNNTATITDSLTNLDINCVSAAITSFYSGYPDWMDYVKRDTPTSNSLSLTGTACTGTELGWYNSCVHVGEIRSITIPNFTSCTDITATDSLGVFNWTCKAANNTVQVVSTGLKFDKGLTDLIDFTNVKWKNIYIVVNYKGSMLLTSVSNTWWTNPISVANSGLAAGVSKTIYIVTSNSTSQYTISQNRVAIVVRSGSSVVSGGGDALTISSRFNWIEGPFIGSGSNGLNFAGTPSFNVIRNSVFSGLFAISNNNSKYNYFHNISIYGSNLGANMANPANIINGLNVYNFLPGGSFSIGSSDMIFLNSIISGNSSTSVLLGGSNNSNILYNTTLANSGNTGINLSAALRTRIVNLATISNNGDGITTNGSNNTEFVNTVAASNGTEISDFSSTMTFNGIFKTAVASCGISGGSPGITGTCAKAGSSETSPATVTNANISNSFVGKVTSDSSNTIGASGTANLGSISGKDWYSFQNLYRSWGIGNVASFPSSVLRGNCSSTCQIWDWSLKNTDSVLRNVNSCPSGNNVLTHAWNTGYGSQSLCDTNYPSSIFSAGVCSTVFLRNAVEIFGDGIGNDNGLCESNEDCFYTPNIGAYQGHGTLVSASLTTFNTNNCSDIGVGGTISNVKLWKWDTNGY
ncbi:MAG TPA: right-handed parallel beta-helix repeat-containing protein, partial [Leptospiraceae bacterium]|nr:right-handed parallel beta-helix repeat-containing protein [Leptospiraceae bacterium]